VRTVALVAGLVVALESACLASVLPDTTAPLCGTRQTPPLTYAHVIWIWFENHGYGAIVGSSQAPYINRTLIAGCGLATNFHNIAHPSLPNYIAATSGRALGALGPLRNDCNATGACRLRAPSIFSQAPSWRAYAESMPKPCTRHFTGPYAASHNPAVYYRDLPGCSTFDVQFYQFQRDLDADSLPAFAFVTPNMCHSMHNCSVRSGDAWLARTVTRIAASAAYQSGTTAVFVTFDEGERSGSDNCAFNTHDAGCHIATIVISPYTAPRTRSSAFFNHYSLLRTTEELLGIEDFLGQAARAKSMRAAFDL